MILNDRPLTFGFGRSLLYLEKIKNRIVQFFIDTLLPKDSEIGALNGLRAFAIIFVLLNHYTLALRNKIAFSESLTSIYMNLWSGVDLFFVLSGFLISKGLWEDWQKESKLDFKKFYLKRALRIFPAYYFFLSINYLIGKAMLSFSEKNNLLNEADAIRKTLSNSWGDFIFLGNYFEGLNIHTWSVSSEEQFYLIFPLLSSLVLFKNAFKVRQCILWFLYIIPLLFRFYILFSGDLISKAPYFKEIYHPFHTRFDSLLMGVIVMDLYFNKRALIDTILRKRPYRLTALAFFSACIIFSFLTNQESEFWVFHTLKYNILNIGYAGFLLFAVSDSGSLLSRFLSGRIFTPIARLSYTIYLWHFIFMGVAYKLLNFQNQDGSFLPFHGKFILTLIIVCVLSFPLYAGIELPFQKLRRRFRLNRD
ncbi:acyltransferase [Leptospira ellisii]|uniref:Acyltransferase n=1 Tax=Leptospira ellisii TaxID=2023197 RepID=A0A2N0B5R3_9LEPT|nr:acyltransferase [Leptospira ellisii]PKA04594.1 acyltransferase [Leptospira ellisii]